MHVVQPKKKDSMTLVIPAPVVGRNWQWQNYKAGVHKDKRRKSKNNDRISFRKELTQC
jgi:hypothetical protein